MTDKPLHELSIAEAGALLRTRAITARALTEHTLRRIEKTNPHINAFVTVTADRALADADSADRDFANGIDKGPLQGIGYGLKDIYDTAGIRTACHSRLRPAHVPENDSAVAMRFAAQGAVLLGKLTTNEFAIGNPDPDDAFPPARNPWNTDYSPGGSSSGSAAAVAAGLTRIAMGSDTGASIRGPASFCGTVGVKPTFGRVSRRGVFPLSSSLDHCGPLTWCAEDAAIVLEAVAGFDPHDPSSAREAVPDFRALLQSGVRGMRIGVPRHFFAAAEAAGAEAVVHLNVALEELRAQGAAIEEIFLPDYELFVAAGRVLLQTEGFAVHARHLRERPQDFGYSTWMRLIPGALTSGTDLAQAHRVRRMLVQEVNRALTRCNVLVTATSLTPAPKLELTRTGTDFLSTSPMQCIPFNVTGHPAVAMPTGFTDEGLPLALQIVGRHFDETSVFRAAAALERATGLPGKRPAIASAD